MTGADVGYEASPPTRGPSPWGRLVGYGPVIALAVALVAMVALVPSRSPERAAPLPLPTDGRRPDGAASAGGEPCPDRELQVDGDPYSPPCIAFTGDNGGATSPGVTAEAITVTYRRTAEVDLATTFMRLAGLDLPHSTPEDAARTVAGLVEYFNQHFQFYGRRLDLVSYSPQGTLLAELFGGGQEAATADAVTAAVDLGAFADVSANSVPYNDALTKRRVVALGAPYVSRDYFEQRRPYAWSYTPSCTLLAEAAIEVATKTLLPFPARWAAGDLQDRPRKVALVHPDNAEYQRCADEGLAQTRAAGFDVLELTYRVDLATMQAEAGAIIPKLRDEGITSVACACDPLFPLYLTGKATEQRYRPEWLVMGTALTDHDMAGRLYDQEQWSRAFGATGLAPLMPREETVGYRAFKEVRPDEEPSPTVDLMYYELYILALGIQLAGPDLTPQNFERGLFSYAPRTGENGTWSFGPGKYTPQSDAQGLWWDPDAVSPYDGTTGSYVRVGERMGLGEVPEGELPFFQEPG